MKTEYILIAYFGEENALRLQVREKGVLGGFHNRFWKIVLKPGLMAVIKIKQQIVGYFNRLKTKGFMLVAPMVGRVLTNLNTGLTDF